MVSSRPARLLEAIAEAFGAPEQWARFESALRLPEAPATSWTTLLISLEKAARAAVGIGFEPGSLHSDHIHRLAEAFRSVLGAGGDAIAQRELDRSIPVTLFPVLTGLTSPVLDDLRDRIDAIRFLLVASVLQGGSSTAHENVANAIRKTRRYPTDWGAVVRKLPPPAPDRWPVELSAALQTLRKSLNTRRHADKAKSDFLTALLAILRFLTEKRQRDADLEGEKGHVFIKARARAITPGDDADAATPDTAFFFPREHEEAEPSRLAVESDSLTNEVPCSAPAAKAAALGTAFRLAALDQRLRWSWDHLNAYEIEVVRSALHSSLAIPDAGGVLCSLVLATGQPPEALASFPLVRGQDALAWVDLGRGSWTRRLSRPPNAWRASPAMRPALISTAEEIELPMPSLVLDAIRLLSARRVTTAETVGELLGCDDDPVSLLSNWLQPLRAAQPNARLTHGRIARALRVELAALGQDASAIYLMTGQPGEVPPTACYYTSFLVEQLQGAYTTALSNLFDLPIAKVPGHGIVGSELTIYSESLRGFVWNLTRAVTNARAQDNYFEAHNAFGRFTLWLLLFATGHRPVSDPFQSLGLFDRKRGFAVLNDKASFGGKEGRLVPLPPLATAQLARYQEHLQRLHQRLMQESRRDIADKVLLALRGQVGYGFPLFFLVNEDASALRPITLSVLRETMGSLKGLPPNLTRHFLAQRAAATHSNGELFAEMLGHLENSEPAFGKHSPLSPLDFEPIRHQLEAELRSLGFAELSSPLSGSPPTPSNSRLSAHPEALGIARREKTTRRRREAAMRHARELVRKHLGRPAQADQKRVDALFSALLSGKRLPTTQFELIACAYANRVLRQLKYRLGLPLKLPVHVFPPPRMTSTFTEESIELASLASRLTEQFHRLLAYRAQQPTRAVIVSPARAAAEAAVSLALDSRVADSEVIATLQTQSDTELLDTGAFGIYAEFKIVNPSQRLEPRRYRLHPLTALLLDRLARVQQGNVSAPAYAREFRELVNRLGIEAGISPAFSENVGSRTVARWLVRAVASNNRLGLQGNLAAFLEGAHRPVGLPLGDWVRVVTGRRIRDPLQTPLADPLNVAAGAPVDPVPALPPGTKTATEGNARAHTIAFHRKVRLVFRSARVPRMDAKQRICSGVRQLRENDADLPEIAALAAQWLEHLAEHGTYEGPLAARSCERYYYALAPRMLEVLATVKLTTLNSDALAMAYSDFMETVPSDGQFYVFGRLQEFHRFLMDHHGFPTLEWSEVAPLSCVKSVAVDAGFVTWSDYETALNLLLHDRWASERDRVMQATAWLLIFRFGARTSEALGLRRKDFVYFADHVVVLFRINDYRELKSDAGTRQVPLIGPLSAMERGVLDSWLAHVDEYADSDWLKPIFSKRRENRELADSNAIARRITEALRAVTGCKHARPHYGRHAFASRLEWLMTLDHLPADSAAQKVMQRVVGPCDPKAARELLLDTSNRSKRAFWAVALAIGHASPDMTFRTYTHLGDLLTGYCLSERFGDDAVNMGPSTWRYISGGAQSLPARARRRRALVTVTDDAVRTAVTRIRAVRDLAETRSRSLALPPRRMESFSLSPEIVDRALDIAHRRGRLDTLGDRLLIPTSWLATIFAAEFGARETAGYGIRDSRWPPTSLDTNYQHGRTSNRPPAETRRVNLFLRSLAPRLDDPEFIQLTRNAGQVWLRRYRADCTPLVLGSATEVVHLVAWALNVGLPLSLLEVRLPLDGIPLQDIEETLSSAGFEPSIVRYPIEVAFARTTHSSRGRERAAFILRENPTGPLTSMVQVHRCLHVLVTWLQATQRFNSTASIRHGEEVKGGRNRLSSAIASL